jgi:uncharacterized membrane-anchored protein
VSTNDSSRRARRAFWWLTLVAVAAAGSLSAAVAAPPNVTTGLRVAVSGLALVVALVLAARVFIADERARRRASRDADRPA